MATPITFGDFAGYDIKTVISDKLNLGTSSVDRDRLHENFWKIIRGGPKIPENLVMLHYKEEALFTIANREQKLFSEEQQTNLLKLRGIVIDLKDMKIICGSLGYSPVISAEEIPEGMAVDCYGGVHDLSDSNVLTFHTGHDIFQIRTFLYDYIVYYISNTNFDITNSKYYSEGPTFRELYDTLGGPDEDRLYGKPASEFNMTPMNERDKYDLRPKYSNINHIFLIVSPWTQTASQSISGEGYIQYFGLLDQGNFGEGIARTSAWRGILYTTGNTNPRIVPIFPMTQRGERKVVAVEPINRFQANNFLQNGYYDILSPDVNKWLLKSEFVIALTTDVDGNPKKWVRIAHPTRLLREAIIGGNSNLLNRAFQLRDLCNKQEPYTGNETVNFSGLDLAYTYSQLFPFVATPDLDGFKIMQRDMSQIIAGTPRDLETNNFPGKLYMRHGLDELNDWQLTSTKDFRDYRFSNAIFLLIMSSPPNRKAEVAGYYEEYFKIRQYVLGYISTNINMLIRMFFNDRGMVVPVNNVLMFKDFPWSKNGEVFNAAKRLHNIVTNAYNASRGNIQSTLRNVELYLKGEKGSSLYQMYTTIRRSQNLQ